MEGPIYIVASSIGGAHVYEVATKAVDLARRLGVGVRVNFNRGVIFAWPSSDAVQLVADWRAQIGLSQDEAPIPEKPLTSQVRRLGF